MDIYVKECVVTPETMAARACTLQDNLMVFSMPILDIVFVDCCVYSHYELSGYNRDPFETRHDYYVSVVFVRRE